MTEAFRQQLTAEKLKTLTQAAHIEELSFPELIRLFMEELTMTDQQQADSVQIDPRTGKRILFNATRASRPHDNRPIEITTQPPTKAACAICEGNTTGIIDVAPLSTGYTFINKNPYPIVAPSSLKGKNNNTAQGLHFLQWTSTLHDRDWHNLSPEDCTLVMQRLAALEHYLLRETPLASPPTALNPTEAPGFVSIIKNYGRLVGGSLAHGHQQIALTNVAPNRILDNWHFEQAHNEPFAAYMLRENPASLGVRDYGPVALIVPYFMPRPYDMLLVVKDTSKRYLHQLNAEEIAAVARGWRDAIRAIRAIMPAIGRETAFNVVTHNGPGAGLYFEFLPYTQETGGFEHLGLFICQQIPRRAAEEIRAQLSALENGELAA